MPLKINLGLSKKLGEPNYSSRGANVNVELELDSALIAEPDKFKEKVRQVFGLVRASLAEELNGPGHGPPPAPTKGPAAPQPNAPTNGHGNGAVTTYSQNNGKPRPATQSQCKAIFAITRDQGIDLREFLKDRFHVSRPDDLTLKEASSVIDELKSGESDGEGGR